MKKATGLLMVALVAALFGLAGAGCSKSIQSGDAALQNAAPELKKDWDAAMAAMKTNGYAAATLQLQQLRAKPGLSAEQVQAVDKTLTAISDKMYAAANKNDPAAKQAIQDLRDAIKR